jgi:adenylate cyclase
MGKTVLANSGYIDKYIGDGLMALFGVGNTNAFEVCQAATKAALTMIEELHSLNLYLQKHFGIQFQIGIGLHFGSVILGEIGHPEKKQFTAIGDNVNFASRIESTTKKAGAEILASEQFYEIIKNSISKERIFETNIKGKTGKYRLYEIKSLSNPTISKIEKIESYLQTKIIPTESPAYIRLAFHDAGNYSVETSRGGLDASIQFELDREENKGLEFFVNQIQTFQKELHLQNIEISIADLIAIASKIALEKLGGTKLDITPGRIDSLTAGERMKTPHVNFTIEELISAFQTMGLTEKDLVVLSGAHTIGYQNKIAFTNTPYEFDNSYFTNLLDSDLSKNLLDTDRVLLKSANTLQLVLDYASDKELFLKDFKTSFEKLLHLGLKTL